MWWIGALFLVAGVALGLMVGLILRDRPHGATKQPGAADRVTPIESPHQPETVRSPREEPARADPQPAAAAIPPPSSARDTGRAPILVPEYQPLPTLSPVVPVHVAPAAEIEEGELTSDMVDLLTELPGIVVALDETGAVLLASDAAIQQRLVRRGRVAFDSIQECATRTLALQTPQVSQVTLRRPPMRRITLDLRVHGIPLPHQHVLLLMTDLTEEHRLAAVRRDFIANISHELKTPVGAMSLLAEALAAARDDPEAVEHFASRMQTEAKRLTTLINDVIDLSRVQGDNPLAHAEVVSVDDLIAAAVDFVHGAAEAKGIPILVGGEQGEKIFGDPGQLETAVRNVLANAVAYSEPGTQVAVAVRTTPHLVELDVKDQGMGIPEAELDRIFERFYRVDEARSRVTGGTGLGLSIVRNVCRNHGGDCLVWSVEHEGSTFTIQLPRYVNQSNES